MFTLLCLQLGHQLRILAFPCLEAPIGQHIFFMCHVKRSLPIQKGMFDLLIKRVARKALTFRQMPYCRFRRAQIVRDNIARKSVIEAV